MGQDFYFIYLFKVKLEMLCFVYVLSLQPPTELLNDFYNIKQMISDNKSSVIIGAHIGKKFSYLFTTFGER